MRYVFVVGCPRSGTSLVRNILNLHPGVRGGPESHLYPTLHGAVDGQPAGPATWTRTLERYDAFGDANVGPHRWIDRASLEVLLERAASTPGDPLEAADDVVAAVLDHYARRFRLAPDAVLVEKTPRHLFYAERILRRFPGAGIVEVRRDGRDVCVSMERRAQRVAWPPTDRSEQIRTWTEAMLEGMRRSADPDCAPRWHTVRFEDLVGSREEEIRRLFRFVGLPADGELVRRIAIDTDISRDPNAGDGEHVRTGVVGDWRERFDDGDIALFQELAGDVMTTAGYVT